MVKNDYDVFFESSSAPFLLGTLAEDFTYQHRTLIQILRGVTPAVISV